jgi:non-specific serine/threonine protein kinase/serine/threonine-protein kinase
MGIVYEAEQTEPVHRRVALKIIKLGMDTKQIVARFEAERQALAVMDHPNIARVFDAGSTETGRPFFAMELVKGTPLDDYCDTHKLPTDARIELFIHVCHAVQHAHQKGVIHRDLKPSNVLVTIQDGTPVPKVIDFGIAKAIGHQLTEKTLVTQLGQLIGTPRYMSPEQAEMSALDVDTRTDIYSLGIMLYELLVGAAPFDFGNIGFAAVQELIRELDPPTPSSRLTTLGGELQETVARYRATDPFTLKRELKGDLDWVVMKCLEKDRTRRYETANGLALELERHLRDEPVVARPPSTSYRLGKFVRRNRTAVIAAALVIVSLVAGLVASAIGFLQASEERDRANRELVKATAVTRFMQESILSSDPREGLGPDATVLQALDYAASDIERVLDTPEMVPEVEASVRDAVGWSYYKLGQTERAVPFLERALELRDELLGTEAEETALSMMRLGQVLGELGRFDAADSLFVRSRSSFAAALGDAHPSIANPIMHRGALMRELGRNDEARVLLTEAHERFARVDSSSLETAEVLGQLGVLDYVEGDHESARSRIVRQLEIHRQHWDLDHPVLLEARGNLAAVLEQLGDTDAAESEYREVIAAWRPLGRAHLIDITPIMGNLALLLENRGAADEAEELYREVLAVRREQLPRPHEDTGTALINYGVFLCFQERFEDGTDMLREAVEELESYFDVSHWMAGNARYWLGDCLFRAGRPGEAEPFLLDAVSIFTEALDPDHPRAVRARGRLADLYESLGRLEEAKEYRGG